MLTGPERGASITARVSKPAAALGRLPQLATGVSLLLIAGCASAPASRDLAPFPEPRQATPAEVLAAWNGYCDAIRTFSGSGDLSIRDSRAGRSGQVGVRVVAARPGRLYLKGSVAVVTGIEVVSDGERFWFQVPSKKKVWTGRNDADPEPVEAADQEQPYYALRPSTVTSALLPEPMDPAQQETLIFSGERESFLLVLARVEGDRGLVARRAWLGREDLRPSRMQTFDAGGELLADVAWRDWRDGTPHDITIVQPLDGYLARFLLRSVKTNVEVPDRAFQPRTPEDYEVIELQD